MQPLQYATEREEEANNKQQAIPVVRIPSSRDKPLTQEEFQNLLQLGGYTATLLPTNPNAPHQEYLLQPKYAQRPEYILEQQQDPYQLQQQQQPLKRRPSYSPAAA